MRNTILALAAAGPLTFVVLTPAVAVGLMCPTPNMERCPIDEVYGNPTPRPSSYQVPPTQIRHARTHHERYPYNG
jgi:hypothetical protein